MVNKVILVGHLGRDPELRYTPNGQPVASFSIATNEVWNNREGERQERTEWHRIVVWGKAAEFCGNYLSKGRLVYVEGRLQTREWEDKEGDKRRTTEVVATNVQALGGRREDGGRGGQDHGGGDPGPHDGSSGAHDGPSGAHDGPSGGGSDDIPF
jgi:single-strand DNA-binding protein